MGGQFLNLGCINFENKIKFKRNSALFSEVTEMTSHKKMTHPKKNIVKNSAEFKTLKLEQLDYVTGGWNPGGTVPKLRQ